MRDLATARKSTGCGRSDCGRSERKEWGEADRRWIGGWVGTIYRAALEGSKTREKVF
jgi:hypothetical protein